MFLFRIAICVIMVAYGATGESDEMYNLNGNYIHPEFSFWPLKTTYDHGKNVNIWKRDVSSPVGQSEGGKILTSNVEKELSPKIQVNQSEIHPSEKSPSVKGKLYLLKNKKNILKEWLKAC